MNILFSVHTNPSSNYYTKNFQKIYIKKISVNEIKWVSSLTTIVKNPENQEILLEKKMHIVILQHLVSDI